MKGNIKYKCLGFCRLSCCAGREYRLKYLKDTLVRAIMGSAGIMVFKTKKLAEDFAFANPEGVKQVVRVRCFGRGRSIKWLGSSHTTSLKHFYRKLRDAGLSTLVMGRDRCPAMEGFQSAPEGTICYPKVEVID